MGASGETSPSAGPSRANNALRFPRLARCGSSSRARCFRTMASSRAWLAITQGSSSRTLHLGITRTRFRDWPTRAISFIKRVEASPWTETFPSTDLPPVGAGTSYAYLMWTFPPNGVSQTPNCAQAGQAGIAYVDIRIDQGAVQRANCSDGFTQPGFRTSYLPAGLHQIELLGLDVNNFPYYRYAGTLQTNSASPVSASYGFNWNVGGVSIAWQLINGGFILSCSQANVDRVFVNFRNASGQLVYPSSDPQWCGGT